MTVRSIYLAFFELYTDLFIVAAMATLWKKETHYQENSRSLKLEKNKSTVTVVPQQHVFNEVREQITTKNTNSFLWPHIRSLKLYLKFYRKLTAYWHILQRHLNSFASWMKYLMWNVLVPFIYLSLLLPKSYNEILSTQSQKPKGDNSWHFHITDVY